MKLHFAFKIALISSFNLIILCQLDKQEINSVISKEVPRGNNEFALKLLQFLASRSDDGEENFFFSPTSMALALGMVFLGAERDSATQIIDVFNWNVLKRKEIHPAMKLLQETLNSEQQEFELKLANRVWGHKDLRLKNKFINSVKEVYDTEVNLVDFALKSEEARAEVNQWVYQQTNGKIVGFFPPGSLNDDTKLALVNAIYFKGSWKYQFNEQNTFRAPFFAHGSRKNEQIVEMMSMTAKFMYFYDEENSCRVLELPYSGRPGSKVSMLLLLPGQLDGLSKLEQSLTVEKLERWTTLLMETKVSVSLPKFKLNQEIDLKTVLPNLGIQDIFDASKANLSGISENDELFVSSAIHKAYVEVNEKGTEAAAATGITMAKRSLDMNEIFQVDHPFLFVIRHHTSDSILFIGRVIEFESVRVNRQTKSDKRSGDEL